MRINVNSQSDDIIATIRQIIRAIDLQSKHLVKKYGLTGPQLLVLKELYKNDFQTIGAVSRNISLSQATVTSILDRLEKQQFVKRIRTAEDKRKVQIQLSAKATEILDKEPNLLQEDFVIKFNNLEEWEKMLLISSLKRIASMMSADEIVSPPVLTTGLLNASKSDVQQYLEEE